MSEMPWYILSAILVLGLAIQTLMLVRTQREVKHLMNVLLENSGHDPIPEYTPVGQMLKELGAAPIEEEQVKKIKKAQDRIRFKIPNSPE